MNLKDKPRHCLNRIITIVIGLFIVIVGIVCLKGLIESINIFVDNQQAFNKAYSNATAAITSLSPENQELAQISIDHLEQLQQIQKNAASSDVMSFLYSVLSTILVGLCAGFVAKSYSNAEEAKEAVAKAQENALNAEQSASEAQVSAKDALQHFNNSKSTIEKEIETYNTIVSLMEKQQDVLDIISIHIEIVHATAALLSHDQVGANQRIYTINRSVLKLTSKKSYNAVFPLLQELLILKTAVEKYREYANNEKDERKQMSMYQATDRYDIEIEEAVKHCDSLLTKLSSSSIDLNRT